MTQTTRRRLWAPALMMLFGSMIAFGGLLDQGWGAGVEAEVVGVAAALGYYWLGGTDTDMGAMLAQRADERQVGIRQRGQALAAAVMFAGAVAGALTCAALGLPAWPFAEVAAVGATSFFASLLTARASLTGVDSDLYAMVTLKVDERQTRIWRCAAQTACLAMTVVVLVGAAAFTGTRAGRELQVLAAVDAVCFLTVLAGNRAGRGAPSEPR
jgi:hypothetical protein